MANKTIVHVVLELRASGAEVLVRDLSKLQCDDSDNVYILTLNKTKKEELGFVQQILDTGVKIIENKERVYLPNKIARLYFLYKEIQLINPDIVISHTAIPNAYAKMICALIRKNIISVYHSVSDYHTKSILKAIEKHVHQAGSMNVYVSKQVESNYISKIGVRNSKIIENGIDVAKFKSAIKKRDFLRENLNISTNEKIVLQVGRVYKVKGQKDTLNVAIKLKHAENVSFWFAGLIEDGSYYEELLQIIKTNKLDGKVKFLGSRTDIAELIACCDVFVMPSEWEASGIAVLEAIAAGVPAVISDINTFQKYTDYKSVYLSKTNNVNDFSNKVQLALSYSLVDNDCYSISAERCFNEYKKFYE